MMGGGEGSSVNNNSSQHASMTNGLASASAEPLVAVVVARPPDSKPLPSHHQHQSFRRKKSSHSPYKWIFPAALSLVLLASIFQLFYFHQNADVLLPAVGTAPYVLLEAHDEWKLDTAITPEERITNAVVKNDAANQRQRKAQSRNQKAAAVGGGAKGINNAKQNGAALSNVKQNPLYQLFQAAGVKADELSDPQLLQVLPSVYTAMNQMYGDMSAPVILGRETCAQYRKTVPLPRRYTAVAGLFNTGTNAMQFHLEHNVPNMTSTWQVPWGKHRVMKLTRNIHVAAGMQERIQPDVLPVVMMRDPYHWMQSMCKSPYATHWQYNKQHCPNLMPTIRDLKKYGAHLQHQDHPFNVTVIFDKDQVVSWNSLIHLYNDWNRQYVFEADFPRLLVRFEDMLLHAPTIVKAIAECVGVPPTTQFRYQINSAKNHGSHTNFVKAVLKSGDATARLRNMTTEDLDYAAKHLDRELMKVLHYEIPNDGVEIGESDSGSGIDLVATASPFVATK